MAEEKRNGEEIEKKMEKKEVRRGGAEEIEEKEWRNRSNRMSGGQRIDGGKEQLEDKKWLNKKIIYERKK